MKKTDISKIALIFIFLVFLLVCIFLAFNIKMGVSPDSYYHLRVSQAYSTTLGIPQNTPQTYQWRDITRIPYLYFWINGRILNINNGVINEVVLLRIINVIYSLGTVYVMYLLSKEIFKDKWKRVLPVFFLTHTLMFVFLSSSINYDNLANLLSILSIYFFVKFVKKNINLKYLLLMLLSLCIGALTKSTVLPVALILVILSAVEIAKRKDKLKKIKAGKEHLLLIPIAI
ncbi:MAG TPA: glycosyltransferase family 39 protein, partial [Candidatus Dojkabacteria bacterium]|nr:glycosyltransferase family 39 protein [Candidatus Dojkabacteria bacterium]